MKIAIINGSVRNGQATKKVTAWVENTARQSGAEAEFEQVDLDALQLPMFNEAVLPMMNQDRVLEGAPKQWLEALQSADGFIFVTPEYNHGLPSGMKNAIDYIAYEVMHKPFLVVSHGANGGARSAEQLKQTLNANIGAVPLASGITINGMVGFGKMIADDGMPQAEEVSGQTDKLAEKIAQLVAYATALQTLRAN